MGTSIHGVVQIRQNDTWQDLTYCPEQLRQRNYHLFAFLANIRNYFDINGLEPRGLPEDMPSHQCRWTSKVHEIVKRYLTDKNKRVIMPDGSIKQHDDDLFAVICKSEEEAKSYKHYSCHYGRDPEYLGYDFVSKGGIETEICLCKEYPDFQEYLKAYYPEYKNKPLDQIGEYAVDFDCPDYYGHSYQTLDDLQNTDKTGYTEERISVPIQFYHEFNRQKGTLPEGMKFYKKESPGDVIDALQELYQPTILIGWQLDEKTIADMPLTKLINELIDIKDQYHVTEHDVRIVYCFDN